MKITESCGHCSATFHIEAEAAAARRELTRFRELHPVARAGHGSRQSRQDADAARGVLVDKGVANVAGQIEGQRSLDLPLSEGPDDGLIDPVDDGPHGFDGIVPD